uniref:Coiled-coil domain-containing protein 9B n=1 Tax=Oncorhynchus mykiss TaxID=8022 RepID=A0A8K9ULK8_ONCMY
MERPDEVGKCLTEECHWLSECEPHHQESERLDPAGDTDLTIPTSKVEQQEYLCWKMEREQIDRERLARHKNAKGQWRRAWDMDKTENMFSDKSPRERERGPTARGGRNAKRGHPKSNADPLGQQLWGKDKRGKNVPVVSSKAKGKDRLTGRARRWDASEDGEDLQASKTSLEEFLEELDALADPDIDDSTAETPEVKEGDLKMESSLTLDVVKTEKVSGSVSPGLDKAETAQAPADPLEDGTSRQGKAEASPPQATEKKVRFSEELIKGPGAYEKSSTGAQNSARSETKGTSVLKVASPIKNGQKFEEQKQSPKGDQKDAGNALDWGDRQAAAVQAQSSSDGDAPPQDNSVQPLEHAKSNTEELIDSSLSVLSLESGETHPTHTTSTDKARENGKIV